MSKVTLGDFTKGMLDLKTAIVKELHDCWDVGAALSKRQFAAVVKEARNEAIGKGYFKSTLTGHTDPKCEMGDVVTIEILTGADKGEMVTGRFVSWSEKNGRTRIVETTNGQKIRSGRYVQTER